MMNPFKFLQDFGESMTVPAETMIRGEQIAERNRLAEIAMQGLLAGNVPFRSEQDVAELSYKIADAMMVVRRGQNDNQS